ncbi:hypothetical protein IMSHALPRED_003978 [Imshaugia aleurites]|uniref:Uncharacterized protein n=1 Tax=Imshaugia aleurites TaxID=172621 RepID=A0A8H3EKN8_9LECA|nr:hypothetical protein IMSHALPRED_003978 [Imshaugia aleurites]
MLSFKAFKQELQTLLSNVLDEAETLQSTAEDPVVLDRAWVLDKMKSQMIKSEYVLEPRAAQIRQGLGDLFKLPRELREIIYGNAIVDGNMAVLRASQKTHKEGSPLVSPKGIYRLVLGFPGDVPNVKLDDSSARKIQNVHVRVNARGFLGDESCQDLAFLRALESNFTRRKACLFTFERDPYSMWMCAYQVVDALKGLTTFERVILELNLDWMGEPWPDTLAWFDKARIQRRIEGAFDVPAEILEPTLGLGDLEMSKEEQRLTFRPLE